jgi:hypothetical protein
MRFFKSEGLGLRDPTRREVTEAELALPLESLEQEYKGLWLRIVSSALTRALELTIFDPNTNMTPSAYVVLETINSAGPEGITQVDLTGKLGIDPKSIFHFVKVLAQKKYIHRRSIVIRHAEKPFATVLIVMFKWADTKIGEEFVEAEENDDDENDGIQSITVGGQSALSYASAAMTILEKLSSAANGILRQQDIRTYAATVTGFQSGTWWTIRKKLIHAEYISLVNVQLTEGMVSRTGTVLGVKLNRMPKSVSELEEAFSSSFGANQENYLPLLQGVPIEYQIWMRIKQSGNAGIIQSDIKFLGVPHKSVIKRIETLLNDRKCITATPTSVGKIRTWTLKSIDVELGDAEETAQKMTNKSKRIRPDTSARTAAATSSAAPSISGTSTINSSSPSSYSYAAAKKDAADATATSHQKGKATIVSIPNVSSSSSILEESNAMDVDEADEVIAGSISTGVMMGTGGTKHRLVKVSDKFVRRRTFISELLKRKKVVVQITLRRLLNDFEAQEAPGEAHADWKVTNRLIADIVENKEGYVVNEEVKNERGESRPVTLLVDASVDETMKAWKKIVRDMPLDELLHRVKGVTPQNDFATTSVARLESLDERGIITDSSNSKKRHRLSRRQSSYSDGESSVEMSEEYGYEEEEEEVEYMETDDEEELERRKSTKRSKRKEAQTEEEDSPLSPPTTKPDYSTTVTTAAIAIEIKAHQAAIALGLERCKLMRVNVLHAWLCHHLFGEENLGRLTDMLPNNLAAVIAAHALAKKTEETLRQHAHESTHAMGGKSSSAISISNTAAEETEATTTTGQPTSTSSYSGGGGGIGGGEEEPSSLMSALFGRRLNPTSHNNTSEPTPKTSTTTIDVMDENGIMPSRPRQSSDQEISLSTARSRWFQGPEFNMDQILKEMPLYVYMKAIGVTRPPPGVPDPGAEGYKKIGDLPAEAQAHLLSRSNYLRPLNSLTDILKQLNLVYPKVMLEEDSAVVEGPIIPSYVLNPIGIVWCHSISITDHPHREPFPEKLYLFEFDATTPQGSDTGVANFWWRLRKASQQFANDVMIANLHLNAINKPPALKVFPTVPGLPKVCLSNRSWVGNSRRKEQKIFTDHWPLVKLEMMAESSSTSFQPTATMIALAAQTGLSDRSVMRWFLSYKARQEEKAKRAELKRQIEADRSNTGDSWKKRHGVDHDESEEPVKKKRLSRRFIEEEDDENNDPSQDVPISQLRATQTALQVPNKNLINIDINLLKSTKHTMIDRSSNNHREKPTSVTSTSPTTAISSSVGERHGAREDNDHPAGTRGSSNSSSTGSTSRWTQRKLNMFLDRYVAQKAKSGSYLDDRNDLLVGIDKASLAKEMNRPWESLEKYLKDSVATMAQLFEMSTKVAKAIRERQEEENEDVPPGDENSPDNTHGDVTTLKSSSMDIDVPEFPIELPVSIAYFRAHNKIVYSDSSEWSSSQRSAKAALASTDGMIDANSATIERSNEENLQSSTSLPLPSQLPLQFSEATARLFPIRPPSELHAVRKSEAEFYLYGGISSFATCSRAPASLWMMSNPMDAVLSDHIKTLLLFENDRDLDQVVARILSPHPQTAYDTCFNALKQRHVITGGKGFARKPHLTAQWMLWVRHADAAIEFGEATRAQIVFLDNENNGVSEKKNASDHDGEHDHLRFKPWLHVFDPFSDPSKVAALLHQVQSKELFVEVQIEAIVPTHRKSRKQVTVATPLRQAKAKRSSSLREQHSAGGVGGRGGATTEGGGDATGAADGGLNHKPASFSSSNGDLASTYGEYDDISLHFQWWHEHGALERHINMEFEPSFEPSKSSGGMNIGLEFPPNIESTETIDLPCVMHTAPVSRKKAPKKAAASSISTTTTPAATTPDAWTLFVELQTILNGGMDEHHIALCSSILETIRDSKSKGIEIPDLERTLVEKGEIQTYPEIPVQITTLESTEVLLEILQHFVSCRLIIRVHGETDEAWVAAEHCLTWTVLNRNCELAASQSAAQINNSEPNLSTITVNPLENLVVFNPWTNLDGSMNLLFLRRLRAHLALSILDSPGISEELLLDQFELFRPSIARELLRMLVYDGIVIAKYSKYSTPQFTLASAQSPIEPSPVDYTTEEDYHIYLRWQRIHIRHGGPKPPFVVSKSFWPTKDIHIRI